MSATVADILSASPNVRQVMRHAQAGAGVSFASMLSRTSGGGDDKQLREAAQQMVGLSFFLPLLQQAREDPFKTELFHGGAGEEAFGAQLDQQLADRLAQRTGGDLVEAVMRRFGKVNPSSVPSGLRRADVHG